LRLLFLCHRFPYPPNRGGKIRPFNMLRHLATTHEVRVASIARSAAEAAAARGIAPHCASFDVGRIAPHEAVLRMLLTVPTPTPASMGYFSVPALRRRVEAMVEREGIDMIVVHCSSVAPYVERFDHLPKLLDFGDMDSEKWLAYARRRRSPVAAVYLLEGLKVKAAEERLARRFDALTATTRLEVGTIVERGLAEEAGHVPNGVDLVAFSPTEAPYVPDSIVLLGRQDFYPNIEASVRFCRRILPLVRRRRPGATVAVVGAEPAGRVRALARLSGVTVTGSVPDVRPHVQAAAVSAAPLEIARGTQNKILESMAMGVPVVCSSLAAQGVDAVPGEHLLAADSDQATADAVVRPLEDDRERRRFAEAGRARVASHHTWAASARALDRWVEVCLRRFRERAR
jgi:sugar transferase (PEP-CTERM/EpsH1 system associated)